MVRVTVGFDYEIQKKKKITESDFWPMQSVKSFEREKTEVK